MALTQYLVENSCKNSSVLDHGVLRVYLDKNKLMSLYNVYNVNFWCIWSIEGGSLQWFHLYSMKISCLQGKKFYLYY